MDNFEILESSKVGLASPDSYVVTRSKTSFLRLLGKHPAWELMTATASEDRGSIRVCADQRRLIEAALRASTELGGTQPRVEKDWVGREYVKLCALSQEPGESDDLVKSQLNAIIARFFHFYDHHESPTERGRDDMRFLYDALLVENGEDVYLSDGVWLGSDGSIHDRGR